MTSWLADALGCVLDRVGSTERAVGDRFPLSADPLTGEWTTTRHGSWAAGFWVGQLWLRARLTGTAADRSAAERWTARLHRWVEVDTVTRGLILWYGAASGHRLGVSDAGIESARHGAAALLDSYVPAAGVMPWGTAFGDPARPIVARVDGVPGALPLLAWSSADLGPDTKSVAAQHLRTHLRLCGTASTRPPAWQRDADGAWLPVDEPPIGWTRGTAWLLLALADATVWLGESGRSDALEAALAWQQRIPGIPPAVVGRTGSPPDTSAAAIAAVALAKLGMVDDATALVRLLVRDHLSDGTDGAPVGMLRNGCHDLSRGIATRHELVWGDFFLLLALAILLGEVPADML